MLLMHGVSVRLHGDACLEAKPVRRHLRTGRQAYMSCVASSCSQDEIRSPAVADPPDAPSVDVTGQILKISVVEGRCC